MRMFSLSHKKIAAMAQVRNHCYQFRYLIKVNKLELDQNTFEISIDDILLDPELFSIGKSF